MILLNDRSSGGLVIRCIFPLWVGSLSFFLEKSFSCNLFISKRELCSLDHSYALFVCVIMLCVFECVIEKFFPPARKVMSSMNAGASLACFSLAMSIKPAL